VSDALALRAAASTGFRAPTPGQLFTNITSTGFVGSEPVETASLPPTDPAAQYFGGESLQPEESKNYSIGFVLTPDSIPVTLTVDAYQIEVTDRIGYSAYFNVEVPNDPAATAANRAALRDLGVYNWATLGRVQYFTNGFETTTRGVDVVTNYNLSTAFGRFQTTLAGNYNATEVDRFEPGVLSRERVGNIENLNPKIRVNLTEFWSLNSFSVLARAAFADAWTDFAEPTDGGDKEFGSEVTFDLELAYQINDSIRVAVGGDNIFDNYPDKNMRAMGLNGPAPTPTQNWYAFTDATIAGNRYPSASPIGINGAFWYGRVSIEF
jgi:iron complex outermembrane recepter protein